MDQTTTLFASVPKLKDLCYIRCTFSKVQMTHEFLKQIYHCQIVCCRDIIRCNPKAIASPVPGTEYYVYVIVSKKYYRTRKLQEHLEMKSIHYSCPQAVNYEIYKTCLKYSIIYKLLPVWNRVGEYLCKGQQSTELTDELDAIKFDIDIKDEGMFLTFIPLKVKLCPLNLEEIGVSKNILENFLNTRNYSIDFQRQTAFILPSLKRCKVLKVSKEIPEISPLKNYDVIRTHWKHMYGIVMPKSPEGIHYYEISFRGFDHRIFVYPGICLQARLPKIVKCNNQTEIVDHFLEDLKSKVPYICGKEIFFEYSRFKPPTNFIIPQNEQDGVSNSSYRTWIVKNPCFNSKSDKLDVYTYDPNAWHHISFQMNFNNTNKNFDRNSVSLSFENQLSRKNDVNEKTNNSSKTECVKHWLSNSCTFTTKSAETENQQKRHEFKKSRNSRMKDIKRLAIINKPCIRSIESVKISPYDLRKLKMKKIEKT